MNSKIKVKFVTTGLQVNIPATESTKFSELVQKFYEERKVNFDENKDKIQFELGVTNKKIKYDDDSTVKDLGLNKNGIIIVLDQKGIAAPKQERGAVRQGKKVVDEKNEKNIIESFPDILGDMARFAEECMDEVLENKTEEELDYVGYEEALNLKMKDKHAFLFGLIGKYLVETLGADVYIDLEKDHSFNGEEKRKGLKTFRYLSNGFLTKTKARVGLAATSTKELNDEKKRKEINQAFKKKLLQEYPNLKDDNIAVTHVTDSEKFKFLLIPVKDGDLELEQTTLQKFKNYSGSFAKDDPELEEDIPLLDHVILNRSFLVPQYDSTDDSKFGYNELRGKEKYYPPVGWWRYGVIAGGLYGDDNGWLSYDNRSWCVAYVGLRKKEIEDKVKEFENDEDTRHNGKKVGLGVAVCQKPEDMEEDCEEITYKNEKYKIGFMLRIKPDAIRIPKSGKGKYWVVSGTKEDLRPYSILSKRIQC